MSIAELEALWRSAETRPSAELVRGLRAAYASDEVPKMDIVSFIDRVVDRFLPEAGRICSSFGSLSPEDRKSLFLHGLLLAAEMIILCEMRSVQRLRDRALLFLEFASAVAGPSDPFVGKAVQVIGHDMPSVGMTWTTLEKASSLDVLSYHFCRDARFSDAEVPFLFEGKGIVERMGGKLVVSPSEKAEADAFGVFSDEVLVRTDKSRDIRLKFSDRDEIGSLRTFWSKFSAAQESRSASRRENPLPGPGDYVAVQYTGEDDADGYPIVSVVGHDEIRGPLVREELVHYVWTDMVADQLFPGDCIIDAKLRAEPSGTSFSIAESYAGFARKRAEGYLQSGRQFQARAARLFDKWDNRIGWLTAAGFGGVSSSVEGVKEGDVRVMEVESVRSFSGTYINLRPPKNGIAEDYDRFLTGESEGEDILGPFVKTYGEVMDRLKKAKVAREDTAGKTALVRVARILLSRSRHVGSLESVRAMMTASFLAKVAGDTALYGLLAREIAFRSRLIAYAQGEARWSGTMPEGLGEEREHLLALLDCGDDEGSRWTLAGLLGDPSPLCRRIADLLYARSVSVEFRDEIAADSDAVRKRVCSILGVGDAFRGNAVRRAGKYGAVERDDMEFKSSYVFRNDNGEPDLSYQGRGQVFEAVCAFLNKDGGTVYVGVNDNGDPLRAEDSGLNADIRWLRENYKMLNGMRARQLGHAVPEVTSVDSMARFLCTERELFFPPSLQELIEINPTEDADAIRITVNPSLYELAYLYSDSRKRTDGVAYVRDGSQTLRMTDHQKRMRLLAIKNINREIGFIVTIREAIEQRRKLIFHHYASTNGARVQDRFVVPVNLFYNDENVYCFDLEAKSYKQFRLHRIESVEVLDEVYTLPLLSERKCDVFRWLDEGKGSYHIRLRMKVGARNYLLEEYSRAKDLPESEFYQDGPNHWILDTTLYGLGAVRRFYLGLADQIEILDSEDSDALKEELRSFLDRWISAGS